MVPLIISLLMFGLIALAFFLDLKGGYALPENDVVFLIIWIFSALGLFVHGVSIILGKIIFKI